MDEPARIHETHISWITLIGDRAYKLLKPIRTGFLDHREREARRLACLREVELNRRFAPEVYLGVLTVAAADGRVRDHLIEMRRMPAERRLSALIDATDAPELVTRVARAIGALHAASPPADRGGDAAWLRNLWEEGWRQLAEAAPGVIEEAPLARAARLARRFLEGRGPLFARRADAGWIRDGHGDLLADDIYVLDEGPQILDCLAFDDDLRVGDVLGDIAFLAMDLERLGHPDLSALLLSEWSASLDEHHPPALAHHHIAYRAHVRAKVSAIRHVQGDAQAGEQARALHRLCLEHLEAGRVRLVLMGGTPGTGKSTIARALAERTGWSLIATDAVRGTIVGPPGPLGDAYGQGRYAADARDRVYAHLRELAGERLTGGHSVILDASWSSASQRALALELGRAVAADVVELRCDAPADVCARRIAARHDDPSEATAAIAARMRATFDPWPSAALLSTDRPLEESLTRALEHASGH